MYDIVCSFWEECTAKVSWYHFEDYCCDKTDCKKYLECEHFEKRTPREWLGMSVVGKHAEICPVCKGNGWIYVDVDGRITWSGWEKKKCHGCGGKGWIVVPD